MKNYIFIVYTSLQILQWLSKGSTVCKSTKLFIYDCLIVEKYVDIITLIAVECCWLGFGWDIRQIR